MGMILLFVLSLVPMGVFAQTTDVTDPVAGYVDITGYATAYETAQKQEGYARTYYLLTYQLINTGALLEYMAVNHPGELTNEVETLQILYNAVLKLRTEMTIESDFTAILSQLNTETQKTSTALYTIVKGNYKTPEIKGYIYTYRDQHTEDDVAHDVWGAARAQTVYSQKALLVADYGNSVALAEYYTPEETQAITQMETYIASIKELSNNLAIAAESFDEAQVNSYRSQLYTVSDQANALADAMWEDVFTAYRESMGP